jgi:hypothetical protein
VLRGARHNFGIVTSSSFRIHDINIASGKDIWSYELFIYAATPENVRVVYTQASKMLDDQREGIVQYGLVFSDPSISSDPVILHHVLLNSPLSTITPFTQAYHALNPLLVKNEQGTYLDVPRFLQVEKDGVVCHPERQIQGVGIHRFPVDIRGYNIDALVAAIAKFEETVLGVE